MAKILIVDDSTELLDFLSLFLSMKGYEVQTASSKERLNEKMPSFLPDLVILDVWLQGENGRELCREIKASAPTRNIPVILLSASVLLLKDYEECHADDVMEKPFDLEKLASKIEHFLN